MTRLLLPSKILMHLLAGRVSSRSIKHPDAVLQAEHVDIVNDRVSAAVLDAMNAEMIARAVVENCMLEKLDGVDSPVLLRQERWLREMCLPRMQCRRILYGRLPSKTGPSQFFQLISSYWYCWTVTTLTSAINAARERRTRKHTLFDRDTS